MVFDLVLEVTLASGSFLLLATPSVEVLLPLHLQLNESKWNLPKFSRVYMLLKHAEFVWGNVRVIPCFSALWVSASVILDKSIGRMTLIPNCLLSCSFCFPFCSPKFVDLSASIVGVMAGEDVTDSWQSKIRKRWSDESLQLYKMARPEKF